MYVTVVATCNIIILLILRMALQLNLLGGACKLFYDFMLKLLAVNHIQNI